MKLSTSSFRGMAPRITPRALPDNASQQAINSRLMTGDLEAWKRPLLLETLANAGVVRSIFPLENIWLSYEEEVEFARGAILDDDAPARVYITGLDAPRFTTYDLAVASPGTPPYPIETRLLGVPGPDEAPSVTVNVAPPDESNITLTNPGAEAGNTSGWTITSGGLVALDATDVPGLLPQTGSFFFGGGAAAATEAYQSVNLESLGVISGQGLDLTWWQATGANGSLAGMALAFYDDAAALLSTVSADQTAISPTLTWTQRTLSTQVPDGAVSVRLLQQYTRVGAGPDIDAYIDTIAISSIDFTNSFDGSSLSGWTTSPSEGGTSSSAFRRVEIDSDDGWPPPSFVMRARSRVPFFYRDFSTDRSPIVTLQFDWLENDAASNCGLHALLFASASGVGTSLFLSSGSGAFLTTHPSWGDIGANVQSLAPSSAIGSNTRYTVTITATQISATAASAVIRMVNAGTGGVVIDDETVTISVDGPNIGFKGPSNSGSRRVFVDNISVTVAAPDPTQGDAAGTTYTSYVYTYVNDFGEESAPSDPSDTVQRNENATTTVITPSGLPTGTILDYGITFKRIYRAVTGALGSEFLFVAEIPIDQAEYIDTLLDSQLGEALESEDWDLPPSDLRYILALPNGIMVGASSNRLCFSVQNRPHAWPIAFRLAVDSLITGLGNVDTSVVVGTQTFVYTASGNSPDSYSMSKPVAPHSCQSARSVAFLTGIGVVFAGPDGLMAVSGPTEVRNLTETIFTREQWQALDPSTILGIAHDDIYFFFAGTPAEPTVVFLDTFQGAEDTDLTLHTPDVAPDGFAYEQLNAPTAELVLSGSGSTRSNLSNIDAYADASASSPPLNITLSLPYTISITAGRDVEALGASERGEFRIIGSQVDFFLSVMVRSNEVHEYAAVVEGTNGLSEEFPLQGDFDHTVEAVVSATSVQIWADGQQLATVPYGDALVEVENLSLYAATETGFTYHISRAEIQSGITPPENAIGYALDMKQHGFGLIELGMHASAVANDLREDALALVLDSYTEPEGALLPPDSQAALDADSLTIYEWNGGATEMRQSWRGKLWLNRNPMAWPWVRVRAESYLDSEIQFYANGAPLHQQLLASDEAFRLPERYTYNTIDWVIVGTDRIYTVELAEDVMELV